MDMDQMDIILEDMDEEKHRIRYTPFVKKPRMSVRDIPIYATSYDNERKKQARRRRFKFGHPRDLTKWVTDEHADIGEEDEDDEEETWKTHWNTTFQAKMASIALIFSTSNLIRFPFSCYLHGGVIFFLVYSFVVILLIQPLIFFELLIGQFSTNGIKGFSKLDKYASGLPYAVVFICLIFSTFNNAVVGYNGIYAWSSLYTNPAECDPMWNSMDGCVPYENLIKDEIFNESLRWVDHKRSVTTSRLSTELFFREYVLDLDWTGMKLKGNFTWKFLSGLIVVFILAALVVQGRLTSTISKVLVIASLMVPILTGGLYIHQYSMQGAISGRRYFSHFRWDNLYNFALWSEAIRMAFTTSGVGFGLYTHIASRHNFYFDQIHSTSWLICLCLLAFSSLAALVVFTELGILGDILNTHHYFEIFSERSGISFICLSGSLYKFSSVLPVSFIFFLCMNIFGIWGLIVSTDLCSTFVARLILKRFTSSKRLSRYVALIGVIIVQLGFASIFGTEAGHIILDSGHLFGGAWAAVVILLTEMCTAFILYGYNVFIADIEIMIDYPLPALFQLQMKYFCGPALCLTLVLMTIHWFQTPVSYHNTAAEESGWLYAFGICLNLVPVAVMVISALHTVRKTFKVGHLDDAVEDDLMSNLFRQYRIQSTTVKSARERLYTISRDGLLLNSPSISRIGAITKPEWEAHKWLRFHQKIKGKLVTLLKHMRAKSRWEKAANAAVLSYVRKHDNVIKSIYQATVLFVREKQRERHAVETAYLTKLVEKCSIENMIGHFDIMDKEHEEDILLDHLLRSTPLPEIHFDSLLPQQNEYGEIFNKLIGRLSPSLEEQYEALLTRVKLQLGFKDTAILRSIRKNRFMAEQQIISAKEDAPLELTVPLKVTVAPNKVVPQILNVVVLKGKHHSLLRKLPLPRPLVLKIPFAELSDKTMPQVHQHIISLASRYMASTVLKEINPLPPNPKIRDNLHKQVYDFLNPRCTCIIVLEEEPFDWEKRDNWLLTKTERRGIREAVVPGNVEITLAQMIRRNTINSRMASKSFAFPAESSSKREEASSSSSSSRGDGFDTIPGGPCEEKDEVSSCEIEESGELPKLLFWSERVPPGNLHALREARRHAKYVGQYGNINEHPPLKQEIAEDSQEQDYDSDSDDDSDSSKYTNPSIAYVDNDLKSARSGGSLHGSNASKINLPIFDDDFENSKSRAAIGLPQQQSFFSLKPAWSKGTVVKNIDTIKKEEEFGVHHFDSEHHYRKRRLDHVAHLERRLNNNRRDFVYYSAGKCLIVQMRRDNAFIYAESGDSIASVHEHRKDDDNISSVTDSKKTM